VGGCLLQKAIHRDETTIKAKKASHTVNGQTTQRSRDNVTDRQTCCRNMRMAVSRGLSANWAGGDGASSTRPELEGGRGNGWLGSQLTEDREREKKINT